MKTETIVFDLGNSKTYARHKDGLMAKPSAIREIYQNPFKSDDNIGNTVKELHNKLVVRIDSPAMPEGTFEVGEIARKSEDHQVRRIKHEAKYESNIPIILTLASIAEKATQDGYKEKGEAICDEVIKVKVDMVTGLPLTEWTSDIGAQFSDRFKKGKHEVKVYLGLNKSVKVEITFDYVKTLPEAAPVVFSLYKDVEGNIRSGKIFEEFANEYGIEEIDGLYFQGKRLLHIDIGEGTTEFPVTVGLNPDQKFVSGLELGIGEAIENMLEKFSKENRMRSAKRTDISAILEEGKKYYPEAIKLVKQEVLRTQTNIQIADKADSIMDELKNELDIVVVYGGGSIVLKDSLYDNLKDICDDRGVELLYIPEEFATTLYVDGLYGWATALLEKQKKKEQAKNEATVQTATKEVVDVDDEDDDEQVG